MNQAPGRARCASLIFLAAILSALALVALVAPLSSITARADEPWARTRSYALQNVRTHLWFDTEHHKVRGEVTHTLSILLDNTAELQFDSVDLQIETVKLDGHEAKFTAPTNTAGSINANKLIVPLDHPGKRGDKHEVFIRYSGQPKRGLYFILPDKNYPNRPIEIWTQGESEDTRAYIPIYDEPNNRATTEMLLTVPASWLTISNGKLVSVKSEPDGTKTWDWKQSEPISSYLITAVAGEFVEKNDTWRGIPLRYVVPKGQENKIDATFERTKGMLDAFSDRLGVKYPWAQYAQTSVNDFVEGGMENASATTLTANGLVNPQLAPEEREGSDDLNSHELAHQWFGDLVTCKDWANLWLNEGFATYFEHYWTEVHYGSDDAAYEFWRDGNQWFGGNRRAAAGRLFSIPIVTHDSDDMIEFAGNVYTKGSWVLKMLRTKLGDDNFFSGLHHYLEVNRYKNVVTADLEKAIEEQTSINTDQFFRQWVFRAGAPKFEVSYTYDDDAHQVKLDVKQTQKVENLVGLFNVTLDVEIATASGRKTYPIEISKADETFTLAADSAPQMIVFDKGDKILKTLDFKREPALLIRQLKDGAGVTDRAEAAQSLGEVKNNPDVAAALGAAAEHDPFWGVRNEALRALGKIGGEKAEPFVLLSATSEQTPWVRDVAVQQLGNFKEDVSLPDKLANIAAQDKAFTVRAAALTSLAQLKGPNAYDILVAAAKSDSPDDILRNAALRGLGTLADPRAVPTLLEWSATGKPFDTRRAAITALGNVDKSNKEITKALASYLSEPYFDVRFPTIFALGRRGDPDAIEPLEALLKSGEIAIGTRPLIEGQISALKAQANGKGSNAASSPRDGRARGNEADAAKTDAEVLDSLKKLQQQIEEVNARLAKIESQLGNK